MKAYITKNALTKGIQLVDGKISENDPRGFYWGNYWGQQGSAWKEGSEWHRTYASALERAEQMRVEKLKSLEKQIKRIAAIKFTEPT